MKNWPPPLFYYRHYRIVPSKQDTKGLSCLLVITNYRHSLRALSPAIIPSFVPLSQMQDSMEQNQTQE